MHSYESCEAYLRLFGALRFTKPIGDAGDGFRIGLELYQTEVSSIRTH